MTFNRISWWKVRGATQLFWSVLLTGGATVICASALADEPVATNGSAFGESSHVEGGAAGFDFDLDPIVIDNSQMMMALLDDGASQAAGTAKAPSGKVTQEDETGTDPRGFGSKFMPYYRYTKLNNDVTVKELTLFGMVAFSPRLAMTYEMPIVKEIDYGGLDAFKAKSGGLPPGEGFGPLPSGGVPFADLEDDGDNTAIGDLNLRLFYKPESWEGKYAGSEKKSYSFMPVIETTLPTATDDVIGSETWILSPGITWVTDLPGGPPFGLGFFAMMNFFDFDVIKSDDREDVLRYRGRWFWMQPLSKPGENFMDGLYILTEFQPVYDFENDDFDLWISPEFGKIVKPGFIVYGKPGWGIDRDPEDRKFTFEAGVRIFY